MASLTWLTAYRSVLLCSTNFCYIAVSLTCHYVVCTENSVYNDGMKYHVQTLYRVGIQTHVVELTHIVHPDPESSGVGSLFSAIDFFPLPTRGRNKKEETHSPLCDPIEKAVAILGTVSSMPMYSCSKTLTVRDSLCL